MKKFTLYAAVALMLASCQNNSYKISGITDDSMEGKTAYLINEDNEPTDSCTIKDGSFTFKGESTDPAIYRIQIERRSNIVFTEPGREITVDFTATAPTEIPVTDNGGSNTIKNNFMQSLQEFMSEKQNKHEEMLKAGEPQEAINAYSKKAGEEMQEFYKKHIAENKDNIFGAYMLANVARNLYGDIASLDSVMKEVKYSGKIKELQRLRTSFEYKENTKEGKPFVDFKGKSIDGGELSLSDFAGKGKYLIVDFWASWCSPCRAEIPNLLNINKEFGGETFEVLGVNVWDNEQKFKESLERESIDYAQIYVPREVNATELYGINGIPQIMLIGPDGTILKRDLRGDDIRKAVAEALGK